MINSGKYFSEHIKKLERTTNSENTRSPHLLINSRDKQLDGPLASLTTGLLQKQHFDSIHPF